jgi:hypothetical protein
MGPDLNQVLNQLKLLRHEQRELLKLLLLGTLNVQQMLQRVHELRRLHADGTSADPRIREEPSLRGIEGWCSDA